jgi:hypothetical protein
MGSHGLYKLIPETYSPMEGRRICASVQQAIKPGERKGNGKAAKKDDFKLRFGLNSSVSKFVFIGFLSHGTCTEREDKNGHGRKRNKEKCERSLLLPEPAKRENTPQFLDHQCTQTTNAPR